MKNTFVAVLTVSILLSAFCLVTGCQESETAIVQKARIVATENIELKKQLQLRDKEILAIKANVEDCKAEMLKAEENSAKTNIDLLKIVAELSTENEDLREENTNLKAKIAELQPDK